jgi:hypothetical protein
MRMHEYLEIATDEEGMERSPRIAPSSRIARDPDREPGRASPVLRFSRRFVMMYVGSASRAVLSPGRRRAIQIG